VHGSPAINKCIIVCTRQGCYLGLQYYSAAARHSVDFSSVVTACGNPFISPGKSQESKCIHTEDRRCKRPLRSTRKTDCMKLTNFSGGKTEANEKNQLHKLTDSSSKTNTKQNKTRKNQLRSPLIRQGKQNK
jgi:hypothetical protein